MRFIRYQHGQDLPRHGWLLDDKVGAVDGDLFSNEYRRLETSFDFSAVKLLAPVQPGKIIGVGRNYADHAKEQNAEVPAYPMIFLKAPSAVIGPGDAIVLPPQSARVDYEAELAVVIGKKGRWIKTDDVYNHIFGYSIANDVTARDLQNRDGQWTRSKSFDTFCPLGPWVETDLDVTDALIYCRVNGQVRQMSSTREMVFSVPQLVVFISSVMTLNPGDVILTGTPAGIGPIEHGDVVEVEIDGIGSMKNPVEVESHP